MRPTTIKDLAQATKMTHSTVSKALNGHPSISDRTKERITRLAEAMNYRPNLVARQLSERRGRTIGVSWHGLGLEWIDYLADQIHRAFITRGYEVIFSMEPPEKAVSLLAQLMVDGIVVGRRGTAEEQIELLNWRKISDRPLVTAAFKLGETIPSVDSDRTQAFAMAVAHLAGTGRRRVACISHQLDKIAGYQQGVLEHNLKYYPEYRQATSYGFAQVSAALDRLLSLPEPPDAIIAGNAQGAVHTIHILISRGVSVPDLVAVIGYDEVPGCDQLVVPLTTVGPSATEMAYAVADVLLQAVREESPAKHVIIPPQIVVRRSCGAAHAGLGAPSPDSR